ncbi:MAG: PqqD family protein, partial [Syntrophaceae bacterium]|nr:PqqD family protein [Syntrophaceae bacterium]
EPNIVHENIDGETIILNLDSGNYYSLMDVGADIWACIEKGAPVGEILLLIREKYDCPRGNEENTVISFLRELQQEGLIVPANNKPTNSLMPQNWKDQIKTRESKMVFNVPILNKYTDMQDLLLLDPIHEVDATGWPSTKP